MVSRLLLVLSLLSLCSTVAAIGSIFGLDPRFKFRSFTVPDSEWADAINKADLQFLARKGDVRAVRVSGVSNEDLSVLSSLSGVEKLSVKLPRKEDVATETIAIIAGLSQLTYLEIEGLGNADGFIDLAPLARLQLLDSLILENIRSPLRSLNWLSSLPQLASFALHSLDRNPADFELAECSRLEAVYLGGRGVCDNLVGAFAKQPSVKKFAFWGSGCSSNALSHFRGHDQLSTVSMQPHLIQAGSIESLATCANLTALQIYGCEYLSVGHLRSMRTKLAQVTVLELGAIYEAHLVEVLRWSTLDSVGFTIKCSGEDYVLECLDTESEPLAIKRARIAGHGRYSEVSDQLLAYLERCPNLVSVWSTDAAHQYSEHAIASFAASRKEVRLSFKPLSTRHEQRAK